MSETELGDIYSVMRERSKEKRAYNRKSSVEFLKKAKLNFDIKNDGAHIIIKTQVFGTDTFIDFYPGTGKYIIRKTNIQGRGVRKLLRIIEKMETNNRLGK